MKEEQKPTVIYIAMPQSKLKKFIKGAFLVTLAALGISDYYYPEATKKGVQFAAKSVLNYIIGDLRYQDTRNGKSEERSWQICIPNTPLEISKTPSVSKMREANISQAKPLPPQITQPATQTTPPAVEALQPTPQPKDQPQPVSAAVQEYVDKYFFLKTQVSDHPSERPLTPKELKDTFTQIINNRDLLEKIKDPVRKSASERMYLDESNRMTVVEKKIAYLMKNDMQDYQTRASQAINFIIEQYSAPALKDDARLARIRHIYCLRLFDLILYKHCVNLGIIQPSPQIAPSSSLPLNRNLATGNENIPHSAKRFMIAPDSHSSYSNRPFKLTQTLLEERKDMKRTSFHRRCGRLG